ncbi:MAG: YraN family protein [Clostridia bacterium]|nr:YraN family protein [Clostridia bacterium]MBO7549182.1 YraN family protein [Clostridia bacterium]
MNSSTFGKAGEDAVERYLQKRGWRVVARNYATNGGELDIAAFRRGVLAFVEVKTRSGESFGTPAEAVDAAKRARIKNAAAGFAYEQIQNGMLPVYSPLLKRQVKRRVKRRRFDVAEVFMTRDLEVLDIVMHENEF